MIYAYRDLESVNLEEHRWNNEARILSGPWGA